MIEISIWKLLLVLIVGLIVIGPKQLPKAAKTMGLVFAQWKKIIRSAQKEIDQLATLENKPQEKKLHCNDVKD